MCHDKGELGTATVTNSTFSGNFADFSGGITNDVGATLTVTISTCNTVANGIGGGIAMVAAHETTATVTNSTFSNGATKPGGKRTATGTRIANGAIATGGSRIIALGPSSIIRNGSPHRRLVRPRSRQSILADAARTRTESTRDNRALTGWLRFRTPRTLRRLRLIRIARRA